MHTLKCFPRMSVGQGSELWKEIRSYSLVELSELGAAVSTHGAEFYPMANSRCTDEDLRSVRAEIVAAATKCGYPHGGKKQNKIDFDKTASIILHETMGILPSDAAVNEVWIFINLRLLPDILVWRYGNWQPDEVQWNVVLERLFKFTRTTFGRLWWRAELLGHDAVPKLGEDEVVQIVERPRIAGYRPLAVAIAERHISSTASTQRMDLLRDVMKRLTRRLAVISIFVMTTSQIEEFVHQAFLESEDALALNKPTPLRGYARSHS